MLGEGEARGRDVNTVFAFFVQQLFWHNYEFWNLYRSTDNRVLIHKYYQDPRSGYYTVVPEFCEMLSQQWARHACLSGEDAVLGSRLSTISLLDLKYVGIFDTLPTTSSQRSDADFLRRILLHGEQPQKL